MIKRFLDWTPQIHASAWVDEQATVIGQVSIGEESSIWPQVVIRGDIQRIEIGARTNIQDGSVLHVTHDSEYAPGGSPLLIGNDVTVGHNATLHACTIEDRCLVGMGSLVLDNAILKAGVMLGAGSLVPPGKTLEGGYLWVGSPARRSRPLTDKEREYLHYSASHYVKLMRQHSRTSSPR